MNGRKFGQCIGTNVFREMLWFSVVGENLIKRTFPPAGLYPHGTIPSGRSVLDQLLFMLKWIFRLIKSNKMEFYTLTQKQGLFLINL